MQNGTTSDHPEPSDAPEHGIKAGDVIQGFCENAAAAVEREGQELLAMVERETQELLIKAKAHHGQCLQFAAIMREYGREQALNIVDSTVAVRAVASAMHATVGTAKNSLDEAMTAFQQKMGGDPSRVRSKVAVSVDLDALGAQLATG